MSDIKRDDLSQAVQERNLAAFNQYLKGARPPRGVMASQSSLKAEELEEKVEGKIGSAKDKPTEWDKRLDRNNAMAVYRDVLYTHANPIKLKLLGSHHVLRGFYEGGKIGVEAGL
jgi:hypothetical protein